ncbi:MAG: CRISPR-associated endonuclease Cas2 [Candidatus Methylomirabilales bacterium]
MEILVAYDVATDTLEGQRRLRQVARVCLDFGQRVQKSVFECSVNEMQYEKLRRRLLRHIDEEQDNLRIYRLSTPKEHFIEHFGVKREVDFHGPLVV